MKTAFFASLIFFLTIQISQAKTLLKACYEDWPPYMYKNEKGEDTGPVITLLQMMTEASDIDLQLTTLPYARCVRDVSISQQDMIIGISGQEQNVTNSLQPIVFWNLVPLVHADSDFNKFTTMDQFKGMRVLVESTFVYPDRIKNWIKENKAPTLRFHYADATVMSNLKPLRHIENKEADVFFEDEGFLQTQIKLHRPNVKLLSPAVVTDPNYIGFSPMAKKYASFFNTQIMKLIEDQTIARVFQDEAQFDWNLAYRKSMETQ